MKSKLRLFIAGALRSLLVLASSLPAVAAYNWGTVALGGGGFATSVHIHPLDSNLWYVRTDVGGAYRYDAGQARLVPMTNFISPSNGNLYGCWGLAVDPTNTNVVYMALGTTTVSNGKVYKSTAKGADGSWVDLGLSQPFYANGVKTGNYIAVNPHAPANLLCSTYNAGLWAYNGTAWSLVSGIPSTGVTVRRVRFDPVNSAYVYALGTGTGGGIFRSTDGGVTFALISGSTGMATTAKDISISSDGQKLYIATDSGLLRYDSPSSAAWATSTITPPETFFNIYRTVEASPSSSQPNRVIAAPQLNNEGGVPIAHVWVSDQAGASGTWVQKSSPIVNQDIPWHYATFPGSYINGITVDPSNPATVMLCDFYTVWRTTDINASTVSWSNAQARGHEETVNLALTTAKAGPRFLYSGHADVSGFGHNSITQFPTDNLTTSGFTNVTDVTDIGVALSNPSANVVYAIGSTFENGADPHSGAAAVFSRSLDGGMNFFRPISATAYQNAWGWGRLAVSRTNADRVVAVTKNNGIVYTTDRGDTWTAATGEPTGTINGDIFQRMFPLAADGVDGMTFYLFQKGTTSTFYRSTDGGATWSQVSVSGSIGHGGSDSRRVLASVPDKAGHLWLTRGTNGLSRSTDGGTTWTQVASGNVTEALMVAIGKPATETGYPTIFIYGKALGASTNQYVYSSTDEGATWTRLNDNTNYLGNYAGVLAADWQTTGRVYLGSSGSGIQAGSLVTGPDTTPPSAPSGLASIGEGKTENEFPLIWNVPYDNVAVTSYTVYVNGNAVGNTVYNFFQITGLAANTSYTFQVKAFDAAGNGSSFSSPLVAKTAKALSAVDDTYARSGTYVSQNFGSSTTIEVRNTDTTGNNSRRGFLRFDLSSVSSFTEAKLRVYGNALSDAYQPYVRAYVLTSNTWVESTLNWNNRPTMTSTPQLGQDVIMGTTPGYYEFDLTAYLQSEKAAGRNNVSIGLNNPTDTSTTTVFNSSEAASNQPKLMLTLP